MLSSCLSYSRPGWQQGLACFLVELYGSPHQKTSECGAQIQFPTLLWLPVCLFFAKLENRLGPGPEFNEQNLPDFLP